MVVLLAITATGASPPKTPESLPLWLLGDWCPDEDLPARAPEPMPSDAKQPETRPLGFPRLSLPPAVWSWTGQYGPQCLDWSIDPDGNLVGHQSFNGGTSSGITDRVDMMTIDQRNGRLRMRHWRHNPGFRRKPSTETLREVSRSASDIVFAGKDRGGRFSVRIARDKDLLTIVWTPQRRGDWTPSLFRFRK
jgi:hypothetical protein